MSRTVEGQEGFLRSQAVDIATFLVMFAREQHISLADGTSGGIVLVGWSLGSSHVHAVVAHLDALSSNVLSDLERYLHTVVCHGRHILSSSTFRMMNGAIDASGVFIGIPNPPGFNIGFWSETDVEKRFKLFYEWVAMHFSHKNVTSGSIDDLEFLITQDKAHSMHELSPEELAELTSAKTFGASDALLVSIKLDVFKAMTRRAIFDTSLAEKFLPKLRVRYMCGGASPGSVVWVLHELRKCLAEPKPIFGPDAEKARDVKFKLQTEGNHFVFWDEPEVALEQYIATINL